MYVWNYHNETSHFVQLIYPNKNNRKTDLEMEDSLSFLTYLLTAHWRQVLS
jgi:hypothetical protein